MLEIHLSADNLLIHKINQVLTLEGFSYSGWRKEKINTQINVKESIDNCSKNREDRIDIVTESGGMS